MSGAILASGVSGDPCEHISTGETTEAKLRV